MMQTPGKSELTLTELRVSSPFWCICNLLLTKQRLGVEFNASYIISLSYKPACYNNGKLLGSVCCLVVFVLSHSVMRSCLSSAVLLF